MLRLTKKADYGLMALKYLAEQAEPAERAAGARQCSAKAIAEAYHIPPQLLAKILQTLTRAGHSGLACRNERRVLAGAAGGGDYRL